jgi:hypothetical protein
MVDNYLIDNHHKKYALIIAYDSIGYDSVEVYNDVSLKKYVDVVFVEEKIEDDILV